MAQMITAVVIASILGGGGTALLLHGPVGWIIGLMIGLAVVAVGREAAEDVVKQQEIPKLLRGLMLSDQRIATKCREMSGELAKTLAKDLGANNELLRKMVASIGDQMECALRTRAEEAAVLVR